VSDLPRFGMARLAKILPCGRFRESRRRADHGFPEDEPDQFPGLVYRGFPPKALGTRVQIIP